MQLLLSACEAATSDAKTKSVRLHIFCSTISTAKAPSDHARLMTAKLAEALIRFDKPMVVALEGLMHGWLLNFIAASSFAIASDSCVFDFGEKTHYVYGENVVALGTSDKRFGAGRALEVGIINRIVPSGLLESTAEFMAIAFAAPTLS